MRRALGLVLAALLLVAGCSGGASNAFKNPHGTLHVKKGDEFRIEFVVNSGVGFDWVMIPRLERSILTAPAITTFYPDENRAGQSGTKRFTFRASATGTETVIFQHVFRGKPRERRVLTVDVSK
ncbi:MAG: Chagasin family peptidase inhibitor [Thermoleophilaceae bacterium]|nr:Chagasin family peptidase inhibitor [Thermoleophilaceae bacterium]MEA2367672.1 Chagasin family peptidase inhibitor [Thermoleophilaceae bacterium]